MGMFLLKNKMTSQHSRYHASWFQEYNIYL